MFEELQRTLEKQLIRLIVATPSHATSQNRKKLTNASTEETNVETADYKLCKSFKSRF